ncbi:MAG: hypothetical protein K6L80_12015 [Agarilytica sp.]
MNCRCIAAVLISVSLTLTACGQTGELRLPSTATEAPSADKTTTNPGAEPVNEASETEVN